jgi:hypothetical protein
MADSSLASGPITTGVGSTTVLGNGVFPVFTRIDTSNSMHNASNSHLNLDKSVDANDDVSTQATRRAASKASRVCLSVTPDSETAQIQSWQQGKRIETWCQVIDTEFPAQEGPKASPRTIAGNLSKVVSKASSGVDQHTT